SNFRLLHLFSRSLHPILVYCICFCVHCIQFSFVASVFAIIASNFHSLHLFSRSLHPFFIRCICFRDHCIQFSFVASVFAFIASDFHLLNLFLQSLHLFFTTSLLPTLHPTYFPFRHFFNYLLHLFFPIFMI